MALRRIEGDIIVYSAGKAPRMVDWSRLREAIAMSLPQEHRRLHRHRHRHPPRRAAAAAAWVATVVVHACAVPTPFEREGYTQ